MLPCLVSSGDGDVDNDDAVVGGSCGRIVVVVVGSVVSVALYRQVDCRELRQTSPLSQVVPPSSLAKLSLMFESNSKGKFER